MFSQITGMVYVQVGI